MTKNYRERILIVESDPVISDLVSRQALQGAGYQTFVVSDANDAISKVIQMSPDVIITSLHLPGLSGKDLMVALSSQGIQTPVIVLARKGMEAETIQAFRLGATDYLIWPVREAEIISSVERVLKQVRDRRERDRLARQLQQTNQELQSRVRELTTIFSIGKAMTSITNQTVLFEKILEGAVRVTQADIGWFLLRDETSKSFLLVAQQKLPESLTERLNKPWDDGISSLVALSGETLTIHGDPIKRFKISTMGQSAMIVPIKAQKQVIGLLVGLRRQPSPFTESEQHLLEAVADYASISLVNARLFRSVEERVQALQATVGVAQNGEKIGVELLQSVKKELRLPVNQAMDGLGKLAKDPTVRWSSEQRQAMSELQDGLQTLNRITESVPRISPSPSSQVNLNDMLRQSANYYQHFAQQNQVTLVADLPQEVIQATAAPMQIAQSIEALLSNAIKFCNPGGQVTVRLERTPDQMAHLMVTDTGVGIDAHQMEHIFDQPVDLPAGRSKRFSGLGISLRLVKEIIGTLHGKIWIDSKPGRGTSFHVTLPLTW
ncbi:MAG TPA: ATP-binding protein [Anaerolineaceae bacterium]|nr:ATP-binding protein [Anaerolineaceae bacterium]